MNSEKNKEEKKNIAAEERKEGDKQGGKLKQVGKT